jgi:leucyl-tRNA---protein transferase
MESLFRYVASPSPCGYLPDQQWSLEYEYVAEATAAEYLARMIEGWRHFGTMLFRPACGACNACRTLRVSVERFRPNRSQKRNKKANEPEIELRIGRPSVNRNKLLLYDRYHAYQTEAKGWPDHPAKDAASYASSFVDNPFAVEEWCYYLGGKLVGVGYVDYLPPTPATLLARPGPDGRIPLALSESGEPLSGGLSAIYFYYEPAERDRGLGVWNVLSLIEESRRRKLPYLYLGYYVDGCPSMAYKPLFVPNQVRGEDGRWRDFRE